MNRHDEDQATRDWAEHLLAAPRCPDDMAKAHLALGCVQERESDWLAAIASYRKVLASDPRDPGLQYFGNNNLAYSLIQLGRFDEAEDYCIVAIGIDGDRHNAHKNLGLAYQGRGRWLDAATSFLVATEISPRDPRAWCHLERLLATHPELLRDSPWLRQGLEAAQKAMPATASNIQ